MSLKSVQIIVIIMTVLLIFMIGCVFYGLQHMSPKPVPSVAQLTTDSIHAPWHAQINAQKIISFSMNEGTIAALIEQQGQTKIALFSLQTGQPIGELDVSAAEKDSRPQNEQSQK